jgi:hypothetical protein
LRLEGSTGDLDISRSPAVRYDEAVPLYALVLSDEPRIGHSDCVA